VTGYLVERCSGGTGCSSFTQIATPTTTSYSDTGRTASTATRIAFVPRINTTSVDTRPPSALRRFERRRHYPTLNADRFGCTVISSSRSICNGPPPPTTSGDGYSVERCPGSTDHRIQFGRITDGRL